MEDLAGTVIPRLVTTTRVVLCDGAFSSGEWPSRATPRQPRTLHRGAALRRPLTLRRTAATTYIDSVLLKPEPMQRWRLDPGARVGEPSWYLGFRGLAANRSARRDTNRRAASTHRLPTLQPRNDQIDQAVRERASQSEGVTIGPNRVRDFDEVAGHSW